MAAYSRSMAIFLMTCKSAIAPLPTTLKVDNTVRSCVPCCTLSPLLLVMSVINITVRKDKRNCICVCLSVCLSVCVSVCLSVRPHVSPSLSLGIIFSTGLTFSYSLKDMSDIARKGVLDILRLLWSLGEQCPKLFFKLFDCQIQPMLTYGSEVWGIMADYSIIERVHLFAIKRFLNISTRTPSALVYGETGRYPLYVNTYTRCIKYWLNLVGMPDSRLHSKSYKNAL